MGHYNTEPDVPQVRITTYRRLRRAAKSGLTDSSAGDPVLYEDFFSGLPTLPRPRRS